jgi:hypothetical protein
MKKWLPSRNGWIDCFRLGLVFIGGGMWFQHGIGWIQGFGLFLYIFVAGLPWGETVKKKEIDD